MKQIIVKLRTEDYHELLGCVRWVASDAVSESNRAEAFDLAGRIEKSVIEVQTSSSRDDG